MTARELLVMGIPALVALAGGVLAALWHPSPRARSLIQHFAAGVVLAAIAVEVLPEIQRERAAPLALVAAFAAGSLCMFLLKLATHRLEQRNGTSPSGVSLGLVLAVFIDVAVDGFIIGAGFATSSGTGPVLAIGLAVELLFLGLSLTSDAPGGWRIVALSGGIGAVVLGTSVLGKLLLAGRSGNVLGGALAFSTAALLYLVTEELLVEAHKSESPERETPASTLVLFGGFLAFWVVQLAGH